MCNFDLQQLKDTIIRESSHYHNGAIKYPTELSVSEELAHAIIDLYEEGNDQVNIYYSHVMENVVRIGKELIIDVIDHKTGYIAQTLGDSRSKVNISLAKNRIHFGNQHSDDFATDGNHADILYVFIHELGEAEYLTRQFCRINDMNRRRIRGKSLSPILNEMLAHTYIYSLLNRFNLNEYIDLSIGTSALKNDFLKETKPWKRFIDIVHALASSPEIYDRREEILGYKEFTSKIGITELEIVEV